MKGLLTAAALSAALGLLVLTAMSSANANDRYMTRSDAETMAGRNERVSHPRTILHNALIKSATTRKTVSVNLGAGSITKGAASIAIRKMNKGNPFKITAFSATGFKAKWYENGYQKKVSISFNGKGHH